MKNERSILTVPDEKNVPHKLLGPDGRVLRADGYQNLLNKYGTKQDNTEAYTYVAEGIVPDFELTRHYESNGLFTKIIDIAADEAMKRSFTLNVNEPGLETFYKDVLDELDWNTQAATAIKWARLYGGAIMVMVVDDGRDIDEPLEWDSIRDIEELLVFERAIVQPDYESMYVMPTEDERRSYRPVRMGKPRFYDVNSMYGNFRVHASRCLVFRNGILPEQVSNSVYQLWGMPEYMRISKAMRDFAVAHGNAIRLLDRAVQAVHKIKNLSELLQTDEGTENVLKRLQVVDMARGLLNTIAIDAEGEDYDFKTTTFSGVKEVMESADSYLCTVTSYPQTVLYGRSPDGQNATGESDMENYYNMVDGIRNRMVGRNLATLLDVISYAGVHQGKMDSVPKLKPEFEPLWNLTETEQATVDQTKAQTALINAQTSQIYADLTAIDPTEIRKGLAKSEEYIVEELLDDMDETDNGWGDDPDPMEALLSKMAAGQEINRKLSSDGHHPLQNCANIKMYNDGGPGSGNHGHSGRPGQVGGSGEGGGSGSEAAKDCVLKGRSEAAQKVYDRARENEKSITPVMNEIAADLGGEMIGLEFSVKTVSSVEDKIKRKMKNDITDEQIVASMNDLVRYTQQVDHNKIAESTLQTIDKLESKGYNVVEVDNKYLNPDSDYKGVHLGVVSPEGQSFELQIHSQESMKVKNVLHPMYEEYRNVNTPQERKQELSSQMKAISKALPMPDGIDKVQNFKKQ